MPRRLLGKHFDHRELEQRYLEPDHLPADAVAVEVRPDSGRGTPAGGELDRLPRRQGNREGHAVTIVVLPVGLAY